MLITLVIIGVIAALTVPSLIEKSNKQEIVGKLFKIQGMFQSAVNYAIMDYGPVDKWEKIDNNYNSTETFYSYLKPHLSIMKVCGRNASGCWSTEKTKTLKGSKVFSYSYDGYIGNYVYMATLNDGTNVSFDVWANSSSVGVNTDGAIFFIYVDLNGNKKPNTMGKDVFTFVLKNNGAVVPAGIDNNSARCTKSDNSDLGGIDCAAKVIREGKISYY